MDQTRVLSIFLSVARTRSFTHAAQAVGLTPPAVSRAIAQLEAHLGVRLVNRSTRKVSLTDEGARLFELADAGLRLLDEAMDQTRYSKHEVAGVIRLAASNSFGSRQLIPLIKRFQAHYPDVVFDVLLEDQLTDMITAKIDVGFRSGNEPAESLIARLLAPIRMEICASPDYLREHGTPRNVDELLRHRCTGYRHPGTGRIMPWSLQIDGELVHQDVPAVITLNQVESELRAIRDGIGIGQMPDYMIAEDLAAGTIVTLLDELATHHSGLYIYYAQRKQLPVRVRRFIDFVMSEVEAGWLQGDRVKLVVEG
ncbi:LysR family transcriptional regulator [Pararobbsia silviterrae]|uniref:LysR family transcriptional regulator n=1 Tax=Pararobbsia silviterrae TaxID=1792498 RepID=A0A494Y677_9BURK|nr:LysR family transcriptional regulator [Pararobbsia silviterrae]RKP55836.1 LysR family transcriptional regulator [Pararobbsia silviterrae]